MLLERKYSAVGLLLVQILLSRFFQRVKLTSSTSNQLL